LGYGAVILISRSFSVCKIGWNEDYWLYFEDVDLAKLIDGGKVAVTEKKRYFPSTWRRISD
jgi:hypothetical protein